MGVSMPLFMVRKENFEWIRSGRKRIEVRRGRKMEGDEAVFLCSKWMLKGRIVRREQGKLLNIMDSSNFRDVIPAARSLKEAMSHIEKLYGTTKGTFTAYHFKLTSKKPKIIM